MDIYEDYANWKMENYEVISALIKLKSKVISRFSHVIAVVDYLYNEKVKLGSLEDYLEVIFESGFNYINDAFMTISNILKKEYRNNVLEMDKNSKTINLLLYVNDFIEELKNQPNYKEEDLNKLIDFEQKVYSYISSHKEVPDEMFGLLDDITFDIFDGEFRSVNDIMYDVALDLNLVEESDGLHNIDLIFGGTLSD